MLSVCFSLKDLIGLASIMKASWRVVAARVSLWVTVGSVITLVRLLTYVSTGRIQAHIYFCRTISEFFHYSF